MVRDLSADHPHGAAVIKACPSAMAAVSPGTDVAAAWLSGESWMRYQLQNQNQGCLVQGRPLCRGSHFLLLGFGLASPLTSVQPPEVCVLDS